MALGALGLAERLRRLGAELEVEVSQAVEAAVQRGDDETKLLQEEVQWLQSQLHAERQQSNARLSVCADLKQKLQDAQEEEQRQREAAQYWQTEFNEKEEQYSLMEAKLAAMALIEAEAAEAAEAEPQEAPTQSRPSACDSKMRLCEEPDELPEETLELKTSNSVQSCLEIIEKEGEGRQLRGLGAEGFHTLLLAAIERGEGCGVLLNRLVRSWACSLLNREDGAAMKKAASLGNLEALETLVSLGGTIAVTAAIGDTSTDNGQDASAQLGGGSARRDGCLLCSCAARGDCASLALLLDHLHDRQTLESIRKAYTTAAQHCQFDALQLLATHLIVELSYVGNTNYRAGEYEKAISCYQEAIDLCEEHGGPGTPCGQAMERVASNRDNLVRLRYNLARAFHRCDRWMEAREQASAVLSLDSDYLNAYALRAQAAMSALDWSAAKADWERLGLLADQGVAPVSPEVLSAWQRRKEECCRQLAQDHYEALGLPKLADVDDVRKAYRELARRWHPDKHQSRAPDLRDRASKRFTRIRQAYEVLNDEGLKHNYDTELMLSEARPLSSAVSSKGVERELFDHFERAWADHERVL